MRPFRRWAFTLVEVIIATAIVGIAISSSFNVFYTIRRINNRARFYAKILPYVRQEMNLYVTSHNFVTTGIYDDTPFDGVVYSLKGEPDPELSRCQKVTMKFEYTDISGFKHVASFQSYISRDIVNKAGEE
jgi:prepilin-type N-terminal cleavage/methylation domain-containing protein